MLARDKHKKCHPIYMPRLPLVPPQLNSQQPPNGIRNGVGRRNFADQPQSPLRASSGYKFDLAFDRPVIREKETAAGNLHITAPDGAACKHLEVVMGAFGHFVGFCEDFVTVLHVHPVQPITLTQDSIGGPDLPFYFRSIQPGTVRLFTQVKIAGKDFFPRFVVKIQPLRDVAAE
jgi:hypothetical protein